MEPWQIGLGLVGVFGTLTGFHFGMLRRRTTQDGELADRIKTAVELQVAKSLKEPLDAMHRQMATLAKIEAKLENGLLHESRNHGAQISRIETEMRSLQISVGAIEELGPVIHDIFRTVRRLDTDT